MSRRERGSPPGARSRIRRLGGRARAAGRGGRRPRPRRSLDAREDRAGSSSGPRGSRAVSSAFAAAGRASSPIRLRSPSRPTSATSAGVPAALSGSADRKAGLSTPTRVRSSSRRMPGSIRPWRSPGVLVLATVRSECLDDAGRRTSAALPGRSPSARLGGDAGAWLRPRTEVELCDPAVGQEFRARAHDLDDSAVEDGAVVGDREPERAFCSTSRTVQPPSHSERVSRTPGGGASERGRSTARRAG